MLVGVSITGIMLYALDKLLELTSTVELLRMLSDPNLHITHIISNFDHTSFDDPS